MAIVLVSMLALGLGQRSALPLVGRLVYPSGQQMGLELGGGWAAGWAVVLGPRTALVLAVLWACAWVEPRALGLGQRSALPLV